jgi:hypothetical protein
MIGYAIPLERFPNTYNGQALGSVALASQKRHISVYLHGLLEPVRQVGQNRLAHPRHVRPPIVRQLGQVLLNRRRAA